MMKSIVIFYLVIIIIIIIILIIQKVLMQNVNYNCKTREGENGLCKYLENCERANLFSKIRDIQPTLCGNIGSKNGTPVACCTDVNQFLKPDVADFIFPDAKSSDEKCAEYTNEKIRLKNLKNEIDSGVNFIPCGDGIVCNLFKHIVGGLNDEMDEFPHMARIGWERVDGNGYEWKCGGSLISDVYILTAAHCLYSLDTDLRTNEPTMIRLGGSVQEEIKISKSIPHPDYKPPKKYDDIALIRLERSVVFSTLIRPACLWRNSNFHGNATAIGWGNTSPDGSSSDQLQKVVLEIFEDDDCKTGYQKSRTLPNGIINSQFCAGYRLGGKDACQGDSGGPLQITHKDDGDMFDIIGITSFGTGCGSKKGGVYTKISYYIDWIEKNVWSYD